MAGLPDRVLSALALVVLLPILLLIAGVVRLSSPGGVIYRQVRVGQGGVPFRILKFRTMVDGADRLAANVSPTNDPRVTPVGRVLRTWYLDELPQLVNVLRGDMRLVGPRPETPEYVALYTPEERRVLEVKPGLVGPSTVGFMDEASSSPLPTTRRATTRPCCCTSGSASTSTTWSGVRPPTTSSCCSGRRWPSSPRAAGARNLLPTKHPHESGPE